MQMAQGLAGPPPGGPPLRGTPAGRRLARPGVPGGLADPTARHAGATLLTRDLRARTVYERMKVRYEIVA